MMEKKPCKYMVWAVGCIMSIFAAIGIGAIMEAHGINTIVVSAIVSIVSSFGSTATSWVNCKLERN